MEGWSSKMHFEQLQITCDVKGSTSQMLEMSCKWEIESPPWRLTFERAEHIANTMPAAFLHLCFFGLDGFNSFLSSWLCKALLASWLLGCVGVDHKLNGNHSHKRIASTNTACTQTKTTTSAVVGALFHHHHHHHQQQQQQQQQEQQQQQQHKSNNNCYYYCCCYDVPPPPPPPPRLLLQLQMQLQLQHQQQQEEQEQEQEQEQ